MSARPLDPPAIAAIVVLCVIWGLQQVAIKYAIVDIPPITQGAVRGVLATLLLLAYARWRQPEVLRLDDTLWPGIITGLLFGSEFVLIYLALSLTHASHVGLFIYTAPFFFAIGAWFFLPQERLARRQMLGLVVSFIGVGVGLGASGSMSPQMLLGDLLAVIAGAMWGATTVILKSTSLRSAPPLKVLLYQIGGSGVIMPIAAFAFGEKPTLDVGVGPALALAFQVFIVAGLSYIVWFRLLTIYRAGDVSAFTFITPVAGVVAGWALLGEPIGPSFLAAVVLVIAGLVLVSLPPTRRFSLPVVGRAARPDPE